MPANNSARVTKPIRAAVKRTAAFHEASNYAMIEGDYHRAIALTNGGISNFKNGGGKIADMQIRAKMEKTDGRPFYGGYAKGGNPMNTYRDK